MKELKTMDKFRVLVYRVHQKGLEVFLLNDHIDKKESWHLPEGNQLLNCEESTIELDPIVNENGGLDYTIAMEGDYHDIPSIRAMLKGDIRLLQDKINEVLPDLEKGTFVATKEIIKKLVPNEYAAVKELKEIIIDRNTVINI